MPKDQCGSLASYSEKFQRNSLTQKIALMRCVLVLVLVLGARCSVLLLLLLLLLLLSAVFFFL